MSIPSSLFLIAGKGIYPFLIAQGARAAGVKKIIVAAFNGETDPTLADHVDEMIWMRVGQVGALLKAARKSESNVAIMAGQITPGHLFDLRPDLKALMLLAKLKERNAESLFTALANELEKVGTKLLPATTFLDESLATSGHIAGPKLKHRQLNDVTFGYNIAKEISRLDIGQTVIVKQGTVLAVEGFDGSDETIKRGGKLGRGKACMIKVSKPNQDMRFDVPVIGMNTLATAAEAGISIVALEARKTLLLEADRLKKEAIEKGITLWGIEISEKISSADYL